MLPEGLGNLHLRQLDLSRNAFVGTLPSSYSLLNTTIQILYARTSCTCKVLSLPIAWVNAIVVEGTCEFEHCMRQNSLG